MAKKKYTFPGLNCQQCQYHQCVGSGIGQTRYCGGFPKRRKPKRFSRSDPRYKPPKWCPRRISPTVCRIYGFADQDAEIMNWLTNRESKSDDVRKQDAYISVLPSHYKLRIEVSLGMTAKQFYDAVQSEPIDEVFSDTDVGYGEIIEIDDGLKPYFFYYVNSSLVIPLPCFDRSRTKKADPSVAISGDGQNTPQT